MKRLQELWNARSSQQPLEVSEGEECAALTLRLTALWYQKLCQVFAGMHSGT
jgi:hypothetical protein